MNAHTIICLRYTDHKATFTYPVCQIRASHMYGLKGEKCCKLSDSLQDAQWMVTQGNLVSGGCPPLPAEAGVCHYPIAKVIEQACCVAEQKRQKAHHASGKRRNKSPMSKRHTTYLVMESFSSFFFLPSSEASLICHICKRRSTWYARALL